jgi:hypothetical protein
MPFKIVCNIRNTAAIERLERQIDELKNNNTNAKSTA